MTDYVPPATTAAEQVRLAEAEADAEAQRRWFEQVAGEQLERFLHDRTESTATRQNAMAVLLDRLRKSPDFLAGTAALLGPLVDDPDVEVARTAIRHYPLSGEDARVRVRPLLDSADEQVRAEAAVALARVGDAGIQERLFAWFKSDRQADRNAAIEGLVTLNSADARQGLAEAWELGGRGRGDRVTLSVALLRLGDLRGLPFLETVAQEAKGPWSAAAATWIYYHQRARGLRLMRDVLDHGDLEARQSMVMQVANLARLPHVFTAEGLQEARSWVERQRTHRRRNRKRR